MSAIRMGPRWTSPSSISRDWPVFRGAGRYFAGLAGEHLVVTHNFVIGWVVRHVLDAPPRRWIGLNHANCGGTVVRWSAGRPAELVAFNDTGHLEA